MLLLLTTACSGGPTCDAILAQAMTQAQARWPDAAAALDHGYDDHCVWSWSHGRHSVDGFGATMVQLSEKPGIDDAFHLDLGVYANGRADHPSLLFFDQTAGPLEEWPLIGIGYHFDYVPCERPDAECFAASDFFVHEAGYHRVIVGDGGMTMATDADLLPGADATEVDPAGCQDIDTDDLATHVNAVKHGRAWDLHLWSDPAGGPPTVGITDPARRWADAPDRVYVEERAFFYPDDSACGCPIDSG